MTDNITNYNTEEPDEFQQLSRAQLDKFTTSEGVDLNQITLTGPEKNLLVNFFKHLVYVAQQSNPNTRTMNFVRGELLTGKYWLMLSEEARKEYLHRVVGNSQVTIAKKYHLYDSMFTKLHAAAWEGVVKDCVGKVIYDGVMDLEP